MSAPPTPSDPSKPPKRPGPPKLHPNLIAKAAATFNSALERPTAERGAFVEGACAGDDDLRQHVQRLLAAHEEAGGFLAEPPMTAELEEEMARLKPEEAGDRIGLYKLMEQIGEGGFGTVWVADQEKPVRRRVALKIIKLGMDTKEVIARFEQERQALAMMEHANIAKVLDAGTTQYGRPYFVMELVRGVKLTEYCDSKQLSTQERIELFIIVCQAVQHAHQKGIIHRDLKPSNILVTVNDGKAVPKVIDFGVAKATQGRLVEQTVYTQFQQMIGTPLYMSPEQAELTSLDIDTRSDIYSLGVLLYELLTGHTPIEQATLARVGLDEIRRLIREVDPPRPSQRMKTLPPAEMTTAAKRRNTEPAKLSGPLRGDLDWIVMKCIEKDRARRYDTANGLAMDLQRHLSNEVVIARPPTTAYLLGKLVKRNKSAVLAGCTVVLALIVGFAAAVWQARRAQNEAARAKSAESQSALALAELRQTAPAFGEQARGLAAREQFSEAIEKLDYAIKLRPDAAEYLVAKADLLQCQLKLAEAAAVYREALRVNPAHPRAEASAQLCEALLAAPLADQGKLTRESLAKLHLAMQKQQRPTAELMPVARLLGEEKKLLLDYWLGRLKDLPVSGERPLPQRLTVRDDGRLALDLSDTKVIDLGPLAAAPLAVLNLSGPKDRSELTDLSPLRGLDLIDLNLSATMVADLAPLREMHNLKKLYLAGSSVIDLSPLKGLPLEVLNLEDTRAIDLSPLRGMKLNGITLDQTRVTDLSPLAGMPLQFFSASGIPAVDYSPLAGAPLERCYIQVSPLRDLSFLKNSPVKDLVLFNCTEARGFAVLAGLKSLELVILPQTFRNFPAEEVAAIAALRAHPTLKYIQTEHRAQGGWVINTTQSKDIFWRDWDRDEALHASLRKTGFHYDIHRLHDATYTLRIINQPLSDLSFLKDAPITYLIISRTNVRDLSPLADLPLTHLAIEETPVTDLSPLRSPVLSASLRSVLMSRVRPTDFSPLAACKKLETLDAPDTGLTDLKMLQGLKLTVALLARNGITDISPLAGMPLERLNLIGTDVTDLSPLLQCPSLKELVLPAGALDVLALRALPALTKLSFEELNGPFPKQSATEFWAEYEFGGINTKSVSDLSKEFAVSTSDSLLGLRLAIFQAWFGQNEGHAATCQKMLEMADQTPSGNSVSERAVKAWCLRASSDLPLQTRVVALAKKQIGNETEVWQRKWNSQALGMAEFRAGNLQAAETAFLQAEQQAEDDTADAQYLPFIHGACRFFRAMILFKQGKTDAAQSLFDHAEAQMLPLPARDGTVLPSDVSPDQLFHWLVYREAGVLLQRPMSMAARRVTSVLLPPNSSWKWLHPLDGRDPAESVPDFHTNFAAPGFDDAAWQTGQDREGPRGGFGYGYKGSQGVDIGTPASKEVGHSAYFRARFTTDQPRTNLELRCQRDDGIIVYLDGKEVARNNMSDGPEAYQLPALRAVLTAEGTIVQRIALKGVTLPAGEHTLAVSVHNPAKSSSDLRIGGITLVEVEPAQAPQK